MSSKMTRYPTAILSSFCLVLVLQIVTHAGTRTSEPGGTKIKVTVLEQTGSIAGNQTLYLAPNAIRIDNKQKSTVTVAKAPDWRIYIYNPSNKTYFDTTLERYRGISMNIIFLFYGLDTQAFDFKPVGKVSVLGHSCTSVQLLPKSGSSNDDKSFMAKCKSILLADDITTPPFSADLLAKQMFLPKFHRIVIKLDYIQDLMTRHGLETVKWKEELVPRSMFAMPSGLTRTQREAEVYTDLVI